MYVLIVVIVLFVLVTHLEDEPRKITRIIRRLQIRKSNLVNIGNLYCKSTVKEIGVTLFQ